jgi:hypothetical protein
MLGRELGSVKFVRLTEWFCFSEMFAVVYRKEAWYRNKSFSFGLVYMSCDDRLRVLWKFLAWLLVKYSKAF